MFSGILLIVTLVGGTFLFVRNLQKPTSVTVDTPPAHTSVPLADNNTSLTQTPQASLSLNLPSTTVQSGQQFTVSIGLNSVSEIYVVDLQMHYDPQAFTLTKIQPGDFFATPQEFKKTIQQDTGNILYSIGALKPATGNKTLATATFQAKTGINKGTIMITDKSLVATKDALAASVVLPVVTNIQIQN